jgi:hypothetical protein
MDVKRNRAVTKPLTETDRRVIDRFDVQIERELGETDEEIRKLENIRSERLQSRIPNQAGPDRV